MKKIISMAMALVMAMCFVSTSAFAASNLTLTISKTSGYDIDSSKSNRKWTESYDYLNEADFFTLKPPTIWWKTNRNLIWPETCGIYNKVTNHMYPDDNWGNGYGKKAVMFSVDIGKGRKVNLQPVIFNSDPEGKDSGKTIVTSNNSVTFEHYKAVKNIKLTETKTGDIKVTWTDPNQDKKQSRNIKYRIKVGYKGEAEMYYVPMAEKTYYVDVKNNKKEVKSYTIKRKLFKKYVKKGKKLGVVIVPFTKSGSLEKNNLVRAVGDCAYKTIKLTK